MHAALQTILHTWTNGGWVMAALAILALVTYAATTQLLLLLYHRGLTRVSDADMRAWVVQPDRAPRQFRELVRYTQDEIHSLRDVEGRFREVEAAKVSEVDRRLAFVHVLVVSAPLFGLLGTVLGMLLTFRAIGVGGSSTAEIIARGISEALVATQTGMMVAIPGLLSISVAKRWRNEYVAFLARLEGITLRHFRPAFRGTRRPAVRVERSATPAAGPTTSSAIAPELAGSMAEPAPSVSA